MKEQQIHQHVQVMYLLQHLLLILKLNLHIHQQLISVENHQEQKNIKTRQKKKLPPTQ